MLSAINRIAFSVFGVNIAWYGIIITAAMILSLVYVCIAGKRVGLTVDDGIELFLWVVPLAVIFARIFYVAVRPEYFPVRTWDDFVDLIAIWEGGITIIGGIFGGILGGFFFYLLHKKKISFGALVDLVIPTLLLSQALGRWGNFINQEAYGTLIAEGFPQGLPFSVFIENCYEPICPCPGAGWHYATFLYESVWNIVGAIACFVIWFFMYKKDNKVRVPGILGFFYFMWYFLIRAMMEYLRIDAVPVTQIICFILFPLAIVGGIVYTVLKVSYDKTVIDISENKVDYSKTYTKIYLFVQKVRLRNKRNKVGGFAEEKASFALIPKKKITKSPDPSQGGN